jgi:hypothetical protein
MFIVVEMKSQHTVTGIVYLDMLEKSPVLVSEKEGPNGVLLQKGAVLPHGSNELLKILLSREICF